MQPCLLCEVGHTSSALNITSFRYAELGPQGWGLVFAGCCEVSKQPTYATQEATWFT